MTHFFFPFRQIIQWDLNSTLFSWRDFSPIQVKLTKQPWPKRVTLLGAKSPAWSHLGLQGGYLLVQESDKDLQQKEKKSNPKDLVMIWYEVAGGIMLTHLCFQISGLNVPPHQSHLAPLPVLNKMSHGIWAKFLAKGLLAGGQAQIWLGVPDTQLSPSLDGNWANVVRPLLALVPCGLCPSAHWQSPPSTALHIGPGKTLAHWTWLEGEMKTHLSKSSSLRATVLSPYLLHRFQKCFSKISSYPYWKDWWFGPHFIYGAMIKKTKSHLFHLGSDTFSEIRC